MISDFKWIKDQLLLCVFIVGVLLVFISHFDISIMSIFKSDSSKDVLKIVNSRSLQAEDEIVSIDHALRLRHDSNKVPSRSHRRYRPAPVSIRPAPSPPLLINSETKIQRFPSPDLILQQDSEFERLLLQNSNTDRTISCSTESMVETKNEPEPDESPETITFIFKIRNQCNTPTSRLQLTTKRKDRPIKRRFSRHSEISSVFNFLSTQEIGTSSFELIRLYPPLVITSEMMDTKISDFNLEDNTVFQVRLTK